MAKESGLTLHDGRKIVEDSTYFLQVLQEEGRLDPIVVESLRRRFQESQAALEGEETLLVHGDAHGDNIFVKKDEKGGVDLSLLDFEGLRLSNRYHDWAEILNKSDFLKDIMRRRPDLSGPIRKNVENMWLDESVEFDEEKIAQHLCGDDPEKRKNFELTRTYDMLSRIMADKDSKSPLSRERTKLFLERIALKAKGGSAK